MQFDLTLIQSTEVLNKKNNRGGTYSQMELVYKRDGKVEAKAFPEFANKEIYPVLKGLEKDATYTVTTEKVGDFWKWLNIDKSDSIQPEASVGQSAAAVGISRSGPQAPTGKVLGSNYETREERQTRQKLIVAQSSLSAAIEFAKASEPKGTTLTPDQLRAEAASHYNWVFSIATRDLSDIESDVV